MKLSHLKAMHYGIPVNIVNHEFASLLFAFVIFNSLTSFPAAAMLYNFPAQSSVFVSSDEVVRLFLGLLGMCESVILKKKHSSKLLFISRKLRYIELCVKLHVC